MEMINKLFYFFCNETLMLIYTVVTSKLSTASQIWFINIVIFFSSSNCKCCVFVIYFFSFFPLCSSATYLHNFKENIYNKKRNVYQSLHPWWCLFKWKYFVVALNWSVFQHYDSVQQLVSTSSLVNNMCNPQVTKVLSIPLPACQTHVFSGQNKPKIIFFES